jgi:hypothetical protein
MHIVDQAQAATAGQEVKPRPFKLPEGQKAAEAKPADGESPGDQINKKLDESEQKKTEDADAPTEKAEKVEPAKAA